MNIGSRLKALREARGLTLEQVGDYVGVNKATVQRYEIGNIDIKRNVAIKLAECLDTTPSYIMGWTDNPFRPETEEKPTPVSESGSKRNVLRLAGRDGSYVERNLTDEQLAAIKMMIEQLPDADDL